MRVLSSRYPDKLAKAKGDLYKSGEPQQTRSEEVESSPMGPEPLSLGPCVPLILAVCHLDVSSPDYQLCCKTLAPPSAYHTQPQGSGPNPGDNTGTSSLVSYLLNQFLKAKNWVNFAYGCTWTNRVRIRITSHLAQACLTQFTAPERVGGGTILRRRRKHCWGGTSHMPAILPTSQCPARAVCIEGT